MKYLVFFAFVFALPVHAKQFYKVPSSPDTRHVYVSQSGNDSNPCTRALPCKTIKKGVAMMRNGYPDHLYLKSGDRWNNESITSLKRGRSAKEPMVITSYATGPRPKVVPGRTAFLESWGNSRYLVLKALDISGGIINFTGANHDLVFDDNIIRGTGLTITLDTAKTAAYPKNVLIINNIFTGHHHPNTSFNDKKRPSSIYISRTDNLTIRGNVLDFGGWHRTLAGRGANGYNHNVYLQHNGYAAVFEDNIVARGANFGVHGRSGGWFTENTFIENSVGIQCNYKNETLPDPKICSVERNVFMDGRSMYSKGTDQCQPDENMVDENGEPKALCFGSVWGISVADPNTGLFYFRDNLVARGNHPSDAGKPEVNSVQGFIIQKGEIKQPQPLSNYPNTVDFDRSNIVYKWGKSYNVPSNLPNPNRDAGDYAEQVLGLDNSLDAYMNYLRNRPQDTDHYRYSAKAINNFVRAGFGMNVQ